MASRRRRKRRIQTGPNLLQGIGYKGLLKVAFMAPPLLIRPLALPYMLLTFRHFLMTSSSIRELWRLHDYNRQHSFLFRLLRPSYERVDTILRGYGMPCGDAQTARSYETDQQVLTESSQTDLTGEQADQ